MERLLAYIDENIGSLVDDVVTSLYEVDSLFRECDAGKLRQGITEASRRFVAYGRTRESGHLDGAYRFLASIWPPDRLHISAFIRVMFAVEDLASIRAQTTYPDSEVFVEALRVMRATTREAICAFSDRMEGRSQMPSAAGNARDAPPSVGAITEVTTIATPASAAVNGRALLDTDPSAPRLSTIRRAEASERHERPSAEGRATALREWVGRQGVHQFVGRETELQKLWERFRAAAEGNGPEVVGVKAPDGYGKSTLLQTFAYRVDRLLKRPPVYLRTQSHRLFSVPLWPFTAMLRSYFATPIEDPELPNKVRRGLGRLADFIGGEGRDEAARSALVDAAPHLLGLLGDADARASFAGLDGRTAGIRLRRALAAVIRAVAYQALSETGAPLFLEIEDAGEMDGGSWRMLDELISQLKAPARVMVLLTYSDRFSVPAELAKSRSFTELVLKPLDRTESSLMVDRLLEPNRIDDTTRLRLVTGAMGSPLLLLEVVRQLIEDGMIAREGETWATAIPLPKEGITRDLGSIVARRLRRLNATASAVLEVVAIVEDAAGGGVLEEVTARRGIDVQEIKDSIDGLALAGLVETKSREGETTVLTRHPLVRDEVYRQMRLERRRAIHEDAGEVYERMRSAGSFPSLAADHLALAGLPARALQGLLAGVDQALSLHNLVGGLELCNQALGLLRGFAPADYDRFLFQVLSRRERVHGLLGQRDNQSRDQGQLAALAPKIASEGERRALAEREAQVALLTGKHNRVDQLIKPVIRDARRGSKRWAHLKLTMALSLWQRGERDLARRELDAVFGASISELDDWLRGRLLHARGRLEAADSKLADSLRSFFEAWNAYRKAGDIYGEALVLSDLGQHFATRGKFVDAARLLLRAQSLLRESGEPRALCRVLLDLGELHAKIGDFDVASRFYNQLLQFSEKDQFRLERAAATIGQGRILVHRGRFDEAMRLLGQCLKDLGRVAVRHRIYVDGLNALALALATFSRGEKLTVGALRYAGDAADRATESGYLHGLVQALCIQVRGLLALGRTPEAAVRLGELDTALESAMAHNVRMERLKAEVEYYRYCVYEARGDESAARTALQAAWAELGSQVQCLRGTGYEHAFLTNILANREILKALKAGRTNVSLP